MLSAGRRRAAALVTVTWVDSEGSPSCLYDAGSEAVYATLAVQDDAPEPESLTVTVTAYVDEDGVAACRLLVEG